MNARLILGAAGTFALALLLLPGIARPDCGPGPLVFQQSKGIVQQLLGFTTNGTFLPTYAIGITVGTSGCSNSGVVEGERAAQEFVAINADAVNQDAAQGRGEYLGALAQLMGCGAEAHADFAQMVQTHYEALPADPRAAPATWVAQVRAELSADPALAASCARAG